MKKRGVLLVAVLIVLAGLVVLSFIYGRQIFADITAASPYTIFHRATFDYVYSDTVPANNEMIDENGTLSTFSAQGEIEPITFSVRANQDLGKATVTVSDLIFGNSKISKDDIEIYNLKSWNQCNYAPNATQENKDCQVEGKHTTQNVPELLVKDSEQDLIADERGWIESEKKYYPPEVNNTFNVNLEKDKSYTFYLRIKTSEGTTAGKYSGRITFTPEQASGRDINLELEVMPFSLPQDEKDRLVYFNQRTSGEDAFNIGREQYEKYIDKIKEAGLNGIVVYQNNLDEIKWTIDLLASKHFDGPIVFTNNGNNITAVINYATSKGLDPYFYGIDEPNSRPDLDNHLKLIKRVHSQGGKVFAAIRTECVEATDDPDFYLYSEEGVPPATQVTDLPNYANITDQYDCAREKIAHNGKDRYSFIEYTNGLWNHTIPKRQGKEYSYNQIWGQREPFNRRMFGFTTQRLSLDGSTPYTVMGHYSYLGDELNHGLKFYDDFDGPKKEYNTLYPSTTGPVLTLQWEGLREGIDDSRYVTLLKQKINELKTGDQDRATQLEQSLRGIISQYEITAGSDILSSNITDATNQENRRQIANMIQDIGTNTSVITLNKGYNGFVPPQEESVASGLIDKGVVPVQFNRDGNNNWQIMSNSDTFSFEPSIGYYLYNKKDAQNLSLTLATTTAEVKYPVINKGWNLLSNSSSSSQKLSDLKYLFDGKQTSLGELTKSGAGFEIHYLIKNPTAKTAEDAFQKVKVDIAKPENYSIPAETMFWFYIF